MVKNIKLQKLFHEVTLLQPVQHQPLFIKDIQLHTKRMKLIAPFETSFGRLTTLPKIFITVTFSTKNGREFSGIGECPFLSAPWYDGEHLSAGKAVLKEFIIPALRKNDVTITNVTDLLSLYTWVIGSNIAKVGIEGAYWDAVGKLLGQPVWKLWGGTNMHVSAGTSVGLEKTNAEVIEKIEKALERNVQRIKIKIKPGKDVNLVKAVREVFPTIPLQVDGNAAYDLENEEHIKRLQALDDYNLLMIEQPGPNDDIYFHSKLSQQLTTPICLDESILHVRHAYEASQLWGANNQLKKLIINIKPPRVGGFWEAVKIAKFCEKMRVKTWCGGMLESAIGKTANVHLSTLSGFTLPGDHISFPPYFERDITTPPKYKNGILIAPRKNGWGLGKVVV